jgi:hypothetical protein
MSRVAVHQLLCLVLAIVQQLLGCQSWCSACSLHLVAVATLHTPSCLDPASCTVLDDSSTMLGNKHQRRLHSVALTCGAVAAQQRMILCGGSPQFFFVVLQGWQGVQCSPLVVPVAATAAAAAAAACHTASAKLHPAAGTVANIHGAACSLTTGP